MVLGPTSVADADEQCQVGKHLCELQGGDFARQGLGHLIPTQEEA
jgi:hypothetical protein